MADKYDIPFFSTLLERTILDNANLNSASALAAYAIAYRLKKSKLAIEMIKLATMSKTPLELDLSDIEMIGLEAWKALVVAYDRSSMTTAYYSIGENYRQIEGITRWPRQGSGWAEIAGRVSL